MRRRCAVAVVVCVLMLTAGVTAQGPAASPPIHPALATTGGSVTLDTQTGQKIRVTAIATGLVHPWSLAFTDARTLLVTERPGRLRILRDGALQPSPIWQASELPSTANDGLHFIALHPRFTENHLVYGGSYHTPAAGNGARLANIMVSRKAEGVRFALLRDSTPVPKGHPETAAKRDR